jgi:hypothetical protein
MGKRAAVNLAKDASEWPEGRDTTGQGLVVPPGCLAVHDSTYSDYLKRGYIVQKDFPLEYQGSTVFVTLVDLAGTHQRNEERKALYDRNRRNARRKERVSL